MKVNESELLEALRKALQRPADGDGLTIFDLSQSIGCSEPTIRKTLRNLKLQGRLEVCMVRREALDGRVFPVAAYRLKPAAKAKGQ